VIYSATRIGVKRRSRKVALQGRSGEADGALSVLFHLACLSEAARS
jgi:hypothetical protein